MSISLGTQKGTGAIGAGPTMIKPFVKKFVKTFVIILVQKFFKKICQKISTFFKKLANLEYIKVACFNK